MKKSPVTKIEIIPTVHFLYPFIEKHLSKMRDKGWEVVQVRHFKFTYVKCRPSKANYLLYHSGWFRNDRPRKWLSDIYGNIMENYGKKGSQINKSQQRAMRQIALEPPALFRKPRSIKKPVSFIRFSVVELDDKKVNQELLERIVNDRNKFNFMYELKYKTILFLIGLGLIFIPSFKRIWVLGVLCVLWALVSMVLYGVNWKKFRH